MGSPPADDGQTTAQVLSTLFSGIEPGPWVEPYPPAVATAMRWQHEGRHAEFSELHGVCAGLPQGRMAELFGRIAAGGEQLGLSWTYQQEALRWHAPTVGDKDARVLAARSLAENSGYYAIAAGHGLLNVTLRTLLIHPGAAAEINKKHKSAKGFEPFTDNRFAWPAINETEATNLQTAANLTTDADAAHLADIVAALTRDPRWVAVMDRRGVDFHRWRPQSVDGGVATSNPWEPTANGATVLRVYGKSQHQLPDTTLLAQQAADGVDALTEAMNGWLTTWPAALRGLGAPVFKP